MNRESARSLPPGSDEHYSAYVGPPHQYDFMGATQFRLACSLGLREHHKLLDFGCGSLRAGRLFIVYLQAGGYFGIEPNSWLVEQAIEHELGGRELVGLKRPTFDHNTAFDSSVFGTQFDFIVAQSIFSHTGRDLLRRGLASFASVLNDTGIAMVTFLTEAGPTEFAGDGWIYPECVTYHEQTIIDHAAEVGFHTRRIPWFHPRQDWYLFAKSPDRLPTREEAALHLTGRVLGDPELR